MKILLAIDGSSFSDAAVSEVASGPWPDESEVRIISVLEPLLPTTEMWTPPENYLEARERLGEDQARSVISQAGDRIAKEQGDRLRVITEIIKGHP